MDSRIGQCQETENRHKYHACTKDPLHSAYQTTEKMVALFSEENGAENRLRKPKDEFYEEKQQDKKNRADNGLRCLQKKIRESRKCICQLFDRCIFS